MVPKACTRPTDDTICLDFVCGDLLDLAIKPLELGPPKYEETLKDSCDVPCDVPCDPCCAATPGSKAVSYTHLSPHQSGKARLARLIQLLENEGRIADILEAAKNAAVRNRLYKKYGL